jgi:hypothetical protein
MPSFSLALVIEFAKPNSTHEKQLFRQIPQTKRRAAPIYVSTTRKLVNLLPNSLAELGSRFTSLRVVLSQFSFCRSPKRGEGILTNKSQLAQRFQRVRRDSRNTIHLHAGKLAMPEAGIDLNAVPSKE